MIRSSWFAALSTMALLACSGEKSQTESIESAPDSPATPQVASITPESAKAAGIEIAVAGPAEIRETLTVFGSIRPNAERAQDVRARYAGVVREVAKRPGDPVRASDLLLQVESNDSLQPYAIRSPLGGTVLERRVNPGEAVDGSQTLMVVADLSTVWAEFAVFARDLNRVRAGQLVRLVSADTRTQTEAKIAYVAPSGDRESQSVVARAVVENSQRTWVPGQFVTGEIVVDQAQVPVAVLHTALQTLDGASVVFVETPGGFVPRKIQTGRDSKEILEVTNGLSAGERYAARNSYLIKSELLKGTGEEE